MVRRRLPAAPGARTVSRHFPASVPPWLVVIVLLGSAAVAQEPPAVSPAMSFFITSVGRGFGANLGGVAGADAHCLRLATEVGRGNRTWRAYLSSPATPTRPAVHARDRIGKGPWVNAHGVQVAASVEALHSGDNLLGRDTSVSEKGNIIGPGRHDILTGSNPDGTLVVGPEDATCAGWTSHDAGRAMLGHHNKSGGGQRPESWNSAHLSRGCSQNQLRASLGDGLLYCFAAD
jgi:hypothetical protein